MTVATTTEDNGPGAPAAWRIPPAAWYALALMWLANSLNYLDRQIVSILAQAIKADLVLDDAQLGFLLGTAFAVFYSVVGIAMGRISDFVPRKQVMALGLALWSAMTALGGMATSFAMLATARIGVGVGEAVANPCGHALVAEAFPPRNRAAALSVLLTGTFVGTAGAMILGGWFLQHWASMCGSFAFGPGCALPAWQAAMLAVGLPGIPLALLLLTVREPPLPGGNESRKTARILAEFASALPPLTLLMVLRLGGMAALVRNLVLALVVSLVAYGVYRLTGDAAQWAAFGLGVYAVATWSQVQNHGDAPLHALTFGDPAFRTAVSATAVIACLGGTVSVWSAPYAMRTFALTPTQVGASLGLLNVAGGVLGVLAGGLLTDRWRKRDVRAPLKVGAIAVLGLVPAIVVMLAAKSAPVFLAGSFVASIFAALWSGSTAALVQDLVLPRMRGTAAAAYSLIAIVVSSGVGPYWAGKVSKLTGSLNSGLLSTLVFAPLALALLWITWRRLAGTTPEARLARARAAGEPA